MLGLEDNVFTHWGEFANRKITPTVSRKLSPHHYFGVYGSW